jgi:hypothetical protein
MSWRQQELARPQEGAAFGAHSHEGRGKHVLAAGHRELEMDNTTGFRDERSDECNMEPMLHSSLLSSRNPVVVKKYVVLGKT